MQGDLRTQTPPVDVDLRIGHPMEDESCRGHSELSASTSAADPFHDEIDVEHEIAGPVPIVWVTGTQLNPPDVTVVLREATEVRFRINHGFSA